MPNSNKHIINKFFLEINTSSKEKGYYLKDNIDGFLQKEIFSFLENYFNALDSKNPLSSIQLEKLDIDIAISPDLDFEDFKYQILKKITIQVEEVFENKEKNIEGYKLIKSQQKDIDSFFHFLETGTNAWWTTLKQDFKIVDDTIFDEVLNNKNFFFKWVNAVQKPIVRTRFIKQFSDAQIAEIIKKGIVLKKNNAGNNARLIRIEKIKKQIQTLITKNQSIPNQRFLMWEIVVLSLLETSSEIAKQKLSSLIYSLFEFHKKSNFLDHKEVLLNEIQNQTDSQNELEILANLDAFVLIIEKKTDKVILKEKRTGTVPENEEPMKTKTETENNKNTPTGADSAMLESEDGHHSDHKKFELLSDKPKQTGTNNDEELIRKKELFTEKEEQDIANFSDIYVNNAGLVLIHPFLKSLFENCRLLNKDNTINNIEVAAHLLHYAATGKEQDYENAMALEKFLCNIPIAQPIERNIVLSEEMKKEAGTMLHAVLSNWDLMKTSSAELLQNEFLQRPGKLNINGDGNPTIVIERKTQDVLLDILSWNLSIIKLAWKTKIIYVNW
ncbi:contractile injection system tape measure protein [Flavobacterium fluviatile]|uniref:contractile injection system tape measure protein n=1 Tax=Flavobacterium fluviatile TaxID=1862387 RepID=UPI0013D09E71|nr:contractile injection system tape measure protein [Flavobacterium fluviatile]